MKFFLIKSDYDWADEIYLQGFSVITEEQLNNIKEILKYCKENELEEIETFVGTNEEITIDIEDVLKEVDSAEEIAEVEANIITKRFGNSYGDNSLFWGFIGCLPSEEINSENILDKIQSLKNYFDC